MEEIMSTAKSRGLFFLDSRTTSGTVGIPSARRIGVPCSSRDVFLDNDDNVDAISGQLQLLIEKALKSGSAVGIGHCRENTYKAIEKMLPVFKEKGVKIIPVSELVSAN